MGALSRLRDLFIVEQRGLGTAYSATYPNVYVDAAGRMSTHFVDVNAGVIVVVIIIVWAWLLLLSSSSQLVPVPTFPGPAVVVVVVVVPSGSFPPHGTGTLG